MNWDTVKGQWKQFRGKIRQQWGELTENDVAVLSGERDQLVGLIQERYGIARDEAEDQVDEWADALKERI